jgi:hypothetical protein
MTQPLPFDEREYEGWWAKPKPFITLPFVVASVCGHTLSGATVPPRRNSIPAADTTHCSKCTLIEDTPAIQSPIDGIPTVVALVCHHALSGINTPIGPTTVSAAVTQLCATCTSFSKIANETPASFKQWQDSMRAYSWTSDPQEEDPADDPPFRDYRAGRRLLARHYERLRATYEQTVRLLQESVDPALPVVDLDGVALLPAPESEPSIPPQAEQVTPRRVTFDEDQQHPSRETARGPLQFKRIQRGKAYQPGRYAPTGRGWENTSSPMLYEPGDGSSAFDMITNPFSFAETSFGDSSVASQESTTSADDTSAGGLNAVRDSSPFSFSQVTYTPSSPPARPQTAK